MRRFRPGEPVVWRSVSPERREVWSVFPVTLVHDDDDLIALYRRPGTTYKRRSGTRSGPGGRLLLRWDGGHEDHRWHTNEVLVLHRPGDAHSVWAFWRGSDHAFLEWYVNLEAPWRRTSIGFDSRDHILDIVIQPDLSSWRWKDEDELAWAIEQGRLTRAEAEAARAEGERAIERMIRREAPFDGRWTEWHPDPSWAIPRLPDEWREYEPRER